MILGKTDLGVSLVIRHEAGWDVEKGSGDYRDAQGPEPAKRSRRTLNGLGAISSGLSWPASCEHKEVDCGQKLDGGSRSVFV